MSSTIKKLAAGVALTVTSFAALAQGTPLKEIKLDYAYYAPASLLIKKNGWLEEAFKAQGTTVKWVFSRGSNNSLEFLNSGASNFALTSSVSSFISRTNGQPVKAIYNYGWAEGSGFLVLPNSPVKTVADLKGKKIAVTKGTDPYFYLLRSLDANNLNPTDVEIVHLQHPEGKVALEQGRVDAWVGIDPHLSAAQLAGARTVYKNADYALGAFLNTSESFLKEHPEAVKTVIKTYERARKWIIDNPKDIAALVAEETKLPVEVATRQIARVDFSRPVPGAFNITSIKPVVPLLIEAGTLRKTSDTDSALNSLIDSAIAAAVLAGN
ncbi:aliphatic sulfonate ABC transporter substrate-binding protein [Noviherbaspirillum sedimenti]|uniref:Putative aliphatic sulfonates-binding protein n=1 Tax=Noviherbaspirillum sedimenti TaxID=2320865 RepID=A0A3A3G331_9BURK|nr:aliphatic sulfonate ABC transporter substrate-binding protein [Noviherbaspirillum sedimenti]RJG02893.1 aliphatic sulfonate ABC transporter substrate-binding protein [Noviherbaspirillum sedimenti]